MSDELELMSEHPLDLSPGRKLSREELAEALRLSIIAELDALTSSPP